MTSRPTRVLVVKRSLVKNRNVREIGCQHQSEKTEQVGDEINYESSGLKGFRFQLHLGRPVAPEAGKNQHHATDGRNNSQPGSEAGGGGIVSLHLQKFAQGDGEAANGESKDDGGD